MKKELTIYKSISIFTMILDILEKKVSSQCYFLYVSSPGSSPSKVYMFKDNNNKMYAVKLCNKNISRVSLFKECNNIETLKPYLKRHLPKIIGIYEVNDYEIMISECKGIDSLYTSIIHNKKSLDFHLKIWKQVIKKIMKMWISSKENYNIKLNPRNNTERIKRIKNGLLNIKYDKYLLKELWNKKIQVNGIEYMSLSDAFSIIENVGCPLFGVTCHGDPQPSNIIIDNNKDWYLVDWEWSGQNHDYRMMFSHLYGWWNTRMSYLQTDSLVTIEDKIIIKYDLYNNELIDKFQKEATQLLQKYFKIKKNDISDINRFLALLYLGDIRFLSIWDKKEYFPILIGEAIKTLYYVQTNDASKVDSRFTFTGEV